jgi:hypothetical protein
MGLTDWICGADVDVEVAAGVGEGYMIVFPWPMVIVQFVMVTFELLMTMLELLI